MFAVLSAECSQGGIRSEVKAVAKLHGFN